MEVPNQKHHKNINFKTRQKNVHPFRPHIQTNCWLMNLSCRTSIIAPRLDLTNAAPFRLNKVNKK